jgi:hypothetical protein
VGGVERMRIDATGNLGIGTTTPTGKLSITTSGSAAQVIRADNYSSTSSNDGTFIVAGRGRGTEAAPQNPLSGDRLGAFMGAGWTTGTTLVNSAGIEVAAEENFSSSAAGSSLRLFTTPLGATVRQERMRIDAAGNVGIRTNTPEALLHVGGAIASNLQAFFTQGVTDGGFKLAASNGVAGGVGTKQAEFGMYYNGGAGPIGYGSSLSFIRGISSPDGTIGFNTNGVERMRINDAGNLGIGTTTPNAPLQFPATIANRKIVLWEGANNDHQYDGFGINNLMLRYQSDGPNTDHVFFSATNATTSLELLRIRGNGNVGIGAAGNERLDVAGNVRFSGALMPNNLPGTTGQVLTSAGAGVAPTWTTPSSLGTGTINRLTYWNTGTTVAAGSNLAWDNAGENLGIGWAAPERNLHLHRAAAAETYAKFTNTSTAIGAGNGFEIGINATPGDVLLRNYENTSMQFLTNNLERMRITNGGNVGIGTATPSASYQLTIDPSASTLGGILVDATTYTGSGAQVAVRNTVNNTGTGSRVGVQNDVSGLAGNASTIYGTYNNIVPNGTGLAMGSYSGVSSIGTGTRYGYASDVYGAAGNTSQIQGMRTFVNHAGTGITTGYFADVNKAVGQAGDLYGINVTSDNDGTGNSYLLYGSSIGSTAGIEYGLYVTGEDQNYMSGNVGIGNAAPNAPLQFSNIVDNRKLVLSESANDDHQFSGFGTNTNILRYQVPNAASDHVFYAGTSSTTSNELMRITGDGNMAMGSPLAGIVLGGANQKYLTLASTTTEIADAPMSLELKGSNTADITGVIGKIDFINYANSNNYNVARIEATRTNSNQTYSALRFYTRLGASLTEKMTILETGQVGIGDATPNGNLGIVGDGDGVQGVVTVDRIGSDGMLIRFRQDGITQGDITVAGTTVTYNAFTGSHYAWMKQPSERGKLVTLTGKNENMENNLNAELVYGVVETSQANDPKVMGAFLGLQSPSASHDPSNPYLIMAVGNGEMWVVDQGQNVEMGDYLISSSVKGHAMKDIGEYDIAHIVAKVAEPIKWSEVTETINGVKHKRVSVFFESFDKNHKADKLLAELELLKAKISALEEKQDTEIVTLKKQMEEVLRIVGAEAKKKN